MAGKRKVKFNELSDDENTDSEQEHHLPIISNKYATIPIHLPIILTGMFHYGLTLNVQEVLVKGFLTLTVLQMGYDYLIYNSIGGDSSGASGTKKKRSSKDDNLVLLIISAIIIAIVLSVPVTLLLILFGAPLSSHLLETFLLANHLSMIVVNPLLVLFKLNVPQFLRMFKTPNFFKVLFSHPLLSSGFVTLITTWLGVLPIPLDWDRPWQTWPIPLVVGAYAGNFLAGVIIAFRS